MAEKYTTIHYHSYLGLDKILDSQHPRSEMSDGKPAHEETLFIIVHQVYELWFKQIIHELTSVADMFNTNRIDERSLGIVINRLERVKEIMKLGTDQIRVLETMTPLDFLDFRNYLFPASGFQSFQFRLFEVLLGLKREERITYHGQHFASVFPDDQKAQLKEAEDGGTLFELIEAWLERTPFLKFGDFNFLEQYKNAVENMLASERQAIDASEYLSDESKKQRQEMLGGTSSYFSSILDEKKHNEMQANGEIRLSYKASLAALLINLYREEPILHLPYRLLMTIVDIDEIVTNWRYRHAQMVLRMLGKKIGTGGSSGHEYLLKTALKHQIFTDLHNISTLLIPRSELPVLPANVKKELGFFFAHHEE